MYKSFLKYVKKFSLGVGLVWFVLFSLFEMSPQCLSIYFQNVYIYFFAHYAVIPDASLM